MKSILILFLATLFLSPWAMAQSDSYDDAENETRRPHPEGPPPQRLTEEQHECLESHKPTDGTRPSREDMDAALEACGIDHPPPPPRGQRKQAGAAVR